MAPLHRRGRYTSHMEDQLYFFIGENTFMLTEELKRWKDSFIAKHGEANFQMLNGKTCTWSMLLDDIHAAPFLAEKRLVLVEGVPAKVEKEQFERLPGVLHPATILVIADPEPDKRKSVTKFLMKKATVKMFTPFTPKQLVPWLQNIAMEHGTHLEPSVAAHLIAVVGNDQWHLKNELLKVLAYASASPTLANIDHICIPSEKHTVWKMSDRIGRSDGRGAARFARELFESGEDAHGLWNIFLWIIKNMAALWMYQNEKKLPLGDLCKESGVPFPSAQALLPLVKKFSKHDMQHIVKNIVEADEALKTGKIKATVTEPMELITLLEREILLVADERGT